MLRYSVPLLVAGLLAPSVAIAQQAQPEQAPRLKVRLEVSKKLADLFVLKDGKVLLKNGVEVSLLRGCDVELMVADRVLAFGVEPDPRAPADLHRLHVQLSGEFAGMLANKPQFRGFDGKELGMHVPYATISYSGLGGGGSFQGHINLVDPPTPADWEKVRLAVLSQLDGYMRTRLGESLYATARLVYHEKPGWYLDNPHTFVVSGTAELLSQGKEGRRVPFRLAPGQRLWVDTERFRVHDLAVSAPDKVPSGK